VTTPPAKKRGLPGTGCLLFLGLVLCSQSAFPLETVTSSTPTNRAAASLPAVSSATASPADREGVFAVLTANIAHYRNVFEQGQAIIDHTRYANSEEGRAALVDPNSAAARFRDYRQNPNPEVDRSFLDAFRQADRSFTAHNEPQALRDWLDDMSFMHHDLVRWTHVAVGYQSSTKSRADLDAAASTVRQDLADAEVDATAIQWG
jgi:hypothetical protein